MACSDLDQSCSYSGYLILTERVSVGSVLIVDPFLHPILNWIKLFSCQIYMNHLLANQLNYITWMRKFNGAIWLCYPFNVPILCPCKFLPSTILDASHGSKPFGTINTHMLSAHPRYMSYHFNSLLSTYHMVGMKGFGKFATTLLRVDAAWLGGITREIFDEIEYCIEQPFLLHPILVERCFITVPRASATRRHPNMSYKQ